jgi:hypothetical protein
MAELSPEERMKLLSETNPDGTSKEFVEVFVHPKTKREKAEDVIKGAAAVGFIALLMFLGNQVTTTAASNALVAMVTGLVMVGSLIVIAVAAYYYTRSSA